MKKCPSCGEQISDESEKCQFCAETIRGSDFIGGSVKRKGSMLEEIVGTIFETGGFEVERNVFLKGYEIDVLAKFGDRKFIIECKQYEKSYLSVRNLVLLWKGKNEILGADGVILVIYGIDVVDDDRALAEKAGIKIWGMQEISRFLVIINNQGELCKTLLEGIEYREKDIVDIHAEYIKMIIWRSILRDEDVGSEFKYGIFRNILRSRIITDLKRLASSGEQRGKHIDFFENVIKKEKVEKIFIFNVKSKLKHQEIWASIKDGLINAKPFDDATNSKYLKYMGRLEDGFLYYKNWFFEHREEVHKKVLAERLLSLNKDEEAYICSDKRYCLFRVKIGKIILDQSAIANLNALEWILTDQNHEILTYSNEKGEVVRRDVCWYPSGISETLDYVCRLLYEYFGKSITDTIIDRNLFTPEELS